MRSGLVFGKFLPFHAGHEQLIRSAMEQCDQLTVLVCASDREKISEEMRVGWLRNAYQDIPSISVKGLTYSEQELPNTSVANRDVSKVWAEKFMSVLPPVDVVVTGEPYGKFVAEYMDIDYVQIPRDAGLSATSIRSDIMEHWRSIHPVCRRDLVQRICILGTESTGKSTMVRMLAEHFGTTYVSEAGRDLVANSNLCAEGDLTEIALEHARRVDDALNNARRLLFIDTDVYTTLSYSKFLFGKELHLPSSVWRSNHADLRIFLDASAPYVQDGTRLRKSDRDSLALSHLEVLDAAHENYTVLAGSYAERFEEAKRIVSELIPF